MSSRELQIGDNDNINSLILPLNLDFSEYSFANMYLFRKIHAYQINFSNPPHIRGRTRDNENFIMPLSSKYEEYIPLLKDNLFLFPVPEGHFPQAIWKDKDEDYLYSLHKMRTFEGRNLSSRRNLIHQFLDSVEPNVKPFEPALAQDALHVLEEWRNLKEGDYEECIEAINLFNILKLNGWIFYDGDKPIGFIFGEIRFERTFLMHFAKASREYKGLTPYMYQEVAKLLPDHLKWINLEPDLGIPDLRKAKMAYHPDMLLKKYRFYT